MSFEQKVCEGVKQYYGETLKCSEGLKTNACVIGKSKLSCKQREIMAMLPEEISAKFYGCGSPIPAGLEGKTIVDLGCGTGVDVYIVSHLAGEQGKVIGVDMTAEQLDIAKKYEKQIMQKFGFKNSNVEFIESKIEKTPLKDNSVDVVISNCVINLCASKKQVFSQIRRILKPGGELYFSDMYASLRVSQSLKNDKTLWGQGLSGALYLQDFRRIMNGLGFKDCRVMSKTNITIYNNEIKEKIKDTKYYSITFRCFKLDDLQDKCEDYGQSVRYLGGVKQCEDQFELDIGHKLKKGQAVPVCGNTASMIKNSRFGQYFQVEQRKDHKGLFDCGGKTSQQSECCDTKGSCC